jgi:photosystem II stability/assembly factor-like uncharacterized protein
VRAVVVVLALALAACGGGGAASNAGDVSTPPPGETDVLSMAIDPSDGTLLLATSPALYRLAPGARTPERIGAPEMTAPAGTGPLRDLVMRFAGPGELIASGHSAGGSLPNIVGLIRSPDRGKTWQEVSGMSTADYHEIEITPQLLVGLRADNSVIYASQDGGRTFKQRTPPAEAPPIDVSVDPVDPKQWAVSTEQGTYVSINEGGSWRLRDSTFGPRLAWTADGLYAVGRDGKVRRTSDDGRKWEERGTVGSGPRELIADARGELFAAVTGGEVRASRDGGATWKAVTRITGS